MESVGCFPTSIHPPFIFEIRREELPVSESTFIEKGLGSGLQSIGIIVIHSSLIDCSLFDLSLFSGVSNWIWNFLTAGNQCAHTFDNDDLSGTVDPITPGLLCVLSEIVGCVIDDILAIGHRLLIGLRVSECVKLRILLIGLTGSRESLLVPIVFMIGLDPNLFCTKLLGNGSLARHLPTRQIFGEKGG
jgi:hypothetical protein